MHVRKRIIILTFQIIFFILLNTSARRIKLDIKRFNTSCIIPPFSRLTQKTPIILIMISAIFTKNQLL